MTSIGMMLAALEVTIQQALDDPSDHARKCSKGAGTTYSYTLDDVVRFQRVCSYRDALLTSSDRTTHLYRDLLIPGFRQGDRCIDVVDSMRWALCIRLCPDC